MIRSNCLLILVLIAACKDSIKQTEDKVYSRHLQQHVKLTIYNTPVPDDRNTYNLLLLNDGQDMQKLRVKEIVDSLYKTKSINPLVVVAIHPGNRSAEYGVTNLPDDKKNGKDAAKYSAFVYDELYFFIKKRTGVRKFNSIIIAGCSLGGLSALDIAWDHADRINKVGIFSGYFGSGNKEAGATGLSGDSNSIILNKIRSSRKRPSLDYWFYAGGQEQQDDRDKDGVIDIVDDTRDVINLIKNKNGNTGNIVFKEIKEGKHDYDSWSRVFPEFLLWSVGK